MVLKSEIDRLLRGKPVNEIAELAPAATFARTVGLREGGKVLGLLTGNHSPSVRMGHPPTGKKLYYLSEADKATFYRRFRTLTYLASELGQHRNALRAAVRSAGIARFSPDGRDFGAIHLRVDVGPILGPTQAKPKKG